jgi:hypothetical protein
MKNISSRYRIFGVVLFSAGILLAFTLTAALTWASLEADFYGFDRYTNARFDGLSCPLLMTPFEKGSVIMYVNNPSTTEINPIIRIDISTTAVVTSESTQLVIQPGETRRFEQPVSAHNIDLDYFIFAKAFRYPSYPLDSVEATCGILMLNVPFLTGGQIFAAWLALSLLFTCLGLWIWLARASYQISSAASNALRALAVITMCGLFVSIKGIWVLGVISLALTILLVVAFLRFLNPV